MDADLHFILNNDKGLAEVYNECLEQANVEGTDAIILVHDDVWLEHDPRPNLERLFDTYDVVGVAGCSRAEIKSPALWHLMGGGFQVDGGRFLHGAVAHLEGSKKRMTSFGTYPAQVLMIDGVFMALNRKAIESGVKFDGECPSKFHFYDTDFSLSCVKQGLKVGVGDILITHESPGLREFSDDWRSGENYFLNKYGN
jgi:hypothetical protein